MSSRVCDKLKTLAPNNRYPYLIGVVESIVEGPWMPKVKLPEIKAALEALNDLEKEAAN